MNGVPSLVADEESLHRLLDPRGGAVRDGQVHYMAFYTKEIPHRISVDRASYRAVEESLAMRQGCGLAALHCGTVRRLELPPAPPLAVDAVPENGNDAHAEIRAATTISKTQMKTKICVLLAGVAKIAVPPPTLDGHT